MPEVIEFIASTVLIYTYYRGLFLYENVPLKIAGLALIAIVFQLSLTLELVSETVGIGMNIMLIGLSYELELKKVLKK